MRETDRNVPGSHFMRPFCILLFLILFLPDLRAATPPGAFAAAITVLAPNGGETICPNHGEMIVSWSASGLPEGTLINVDLYKNGVITNHILKNIPLTSSNKKWDQLFASGAGGDGYKIRISTADGAVSDESDAPFTLTHVPMSVRIVTPHGGEQWRLGERHRIEWACTGCCWGVNTVTIWLLAKPWDHYHNIVATVSNMAPFYKGYFEWTVGDTLGGKIVPPGVEYKIEVFSITFVPTYADAIKPDRPGLSAAPFGIYAEGAEIPPWNAGSTATGATGSTMAPAAGRATAQGPAAGRISKAVPRVPVAAESIELITPAGGEHWVLGQTQRITWSWSGPSDRTVDILLYQRGRLVGGLAKGIPAGKRAFEWRVGEAGKISAAPGDDYSIEVIVPTSDPGQVLRSRSPAPFALVRAAKALPVPVRRK